jgi:hypothetical protein
MNFFYRNESKDKKKDSSFIISFIIFFYNKNPKFNHYKKK